MKKRVAGMFLATALVASAATGIDDAAATGRTSMITSSYFLAYNEHQQSIFVNQLIEGNSSLVSECAPNQSTEQVTQDLVEFMRAHPLYLQRPAHHAFTQMLLDKCGGAQ